MSRVFRCDKCDEVTDEPIEVNFTMTHDDDDEPEWSEAHLCSWPCLASWAMDEALNHTGAT